jgi:hypothetical protein
MKIYDGGHIKHCLSLVKRCDIMSKVTSGNSEICSQVLMSSMPKKGSVKKR